MKLLCYMCGCFAFMGVWCLRRPEELGMPCKRCRWLSPGMWVLPGPLQKQQVLSHLPSHRQWLSLFFATGDLIYRSRVLISLSTPQKRASCACAHMYIIRECLYALVKSYLNTWHLLPVVCFVLT